MPYGDRKSERVDFERGVRVYIMGIDGSWRRKMHDDRRIADGCAVAHKICTDLERFLTR
jgi:hypothetical protein